MAHKKRVYNENWGGNRKGSGRPPKYSCKMVVVSQLVPETSKELILEFIRAERQKFLIPTVEISVPNVEISDPHVEIS